MTMINIKTYLRIYGNCEEGMVRVMFYIHREKVHFSTHVRVDRKFWNQRTCRVTNGDKNAADKNLVIENVLARINDVIVRFRLKDHQLTKEAFLRAYHRRCDYETFHDYIDAQLKKTSARMEMSTFEKQTAQKKKLKAYAPGLTFDEIDGQFLDNYFLHLRGTLNNNTNTAYKNMAFIKKYVRMAVRDGLMDVDPFCDWKVKNTIPSCTYLTEEELGRMIALYHGGELDSKLHQVLEFFLFMCFSSLHVTDARRLELEQFTESSFTYFRVKLRNSKPRPVVVPISEPLRALLRNIVGTRRHGKVFERLTMADQTINMHLKTIGRMAEVGVSLTCKVARHTFATIFLRRTKDIASLKEILGHSDISETLIYAHVLDASKQEGVKCFAGFEI